MLIRTDTLQPWRGEALANPLFPGEGEPEFIKHPPNIEDLWSVAELTVVGLVKMIPFVVPDGHRIISGPTYAINGQQSYVTELIPPPTQQEIDTGRENETAVFDETEGAPRALLGTLLDEFNRVHALNRGMLAAVAAATTLADLKTRFALLTGIPDRTFANLRTVIRNKLGT